jgi:3',5'-cyclic AMP phosphodiesterase CpdA
MQFAVITDIHFGLAAPHRGISRKLTQHATQLTNAFVTTMNDEVKPTLVLHLGDLIEDAEPATDRTNLATGLGLLRTLHAPLYHTLGNHDQMQLPLDEVQAIFGQSAPYYAFDAGGVHFVCLHSHIVDWTNICAQIDDAQLAWLTADLAQTTLPVVIFTHYSLADQRLDDNYWFAGAPDSCLLQNRAAVRRILADSGKVKLVLNGHLHWNRLDMHDGIPYITVQSLTENVNGDGLPAGAYALVTMRPQGLTVEVRGNDPAVYLF